MQPAPFTIQVDLSLRKIAQTLSGGHLPSIAKAVFSHCGIREHILLRVMDTLNNECDLMCRKNVEQPSLFRKMSIAAVEEFSWVAAITELQKNCPTLLRLLRSLVSRNDHRNEHKRGESHDPGLCMAIATILKERNREMCGIQTYVSLVLFNSRVQKKVKLYISHHVKIAHSAQYAILCDYARQLFCLLFGFRKALEQG